jgi:DNA-3-methyladenine glycosylase
MCRESKFDLSKYKKKLDVDFFLLPTTDVAMKLLGKIFVKVEEDGQLLAGKIVETEAYLGKGDEASHSFPGLTERNRPMFEQGGILYVYKSYGIHHCINFVTEKAGIGAAVLIRAVEPLAGIDTMKFRRGVEDILRLCNGPGNTAKAFGFKKDDNFRSLTSDNLFILDVNSSGKDEILRTKRIGISRSTDLLLRFYLKNSKYISRK